MTWTERRNGVGRDPPTVVLPGARSYEEMERRATEVAMLAMVSSAISSSLDLGRILETIVESVVKIIGCQKAAVLELGEDGTEIGIPTSKGLSEAYLQAWRHLLVDREDGALAGAMHRQLIIPDVQVDPRFARLAAAASKEGFRGFVGTPLAGRDGNLGVLTVYFAQPYSPAPGDLDILITFANQAAIAIEHARLYAAITRERDRVQQLYQQTDAALAQRVEELTTIEAISRQLAGTLDLRQVIDLVLERGLQATRADRGVIALYEAEKHNLRLLHQRGYPPRLEQYRKEPWPDNRGITGRVARTGRPALVPDVRQDPDYVPLTANSRSQLSVPIIYEGRVTGIITLESDRLDAFTADHVRFAELLADHTAIGINNAQLFRQIVEGRDRLQAILNSTHDAVIMLDRAGKATLVNPQAREMFGPEAEEWLYANSLLDVSGVLKSGILRRTDLDSERLAELIHQLREHPDQAVDIEFGFLADGQNRFVEGSAAPVFSAAGEVIGRVAVLRNVTRRWEVEQFREDLTSMVIHNLQGPLAALITSLETLWDDGADSPEMARELLRIAMTSGHKLYSRIDSVLLIRRLEEKQMPMDLRTLPLLSVIEAVVDEYRPVAAMAGVHLEIHCVPDRLSVRVDEDMIGRVFSNLVDNALKFTPSGGRIEVRATLEEEAAEPHALCTVSDSGCGIARNVREVLFEKFRQGEAAPDIRRKGMGIGLYYCKLAVEAHGGHIWVESEKGQGTRFYFTLPAAGDS